ncbi:MAG: hypothetical protein A2010_09145 [Nitrospirae bacterium GWD2_57_9]|nr:MAG: hypothetical protein A2010_09145 [Nitrospirae bacterium GWD2_57_9]
MLVSKRKRYLSGPDWVINTLDHMMKATTSAGNMSQVVLQFDSPQDENEIRTRLARFVGAFPVLEGSVSRDIKLAPYWKIPATTNKTLLFTVHRLDDGDGSAFLSLLEKSVNTPFPGRKEHLAFHLLNGTGRSFLAMAFDHAVFDARGAEMFLNLFQESMNSGGPVSGDIAFVSSSGLTEWSKKFLAGRNVNRRIIALSRSTPEVLAPPAAGGRSYRYHLLRFSEEETAYIYDRAYDEAGYLMESPYLLAAIIETVHDLFKDRTGSGSSYLIPVTMDLRPGLDQLQEIFFNYVSYLFYQVPVGDAGDRKALIALLKQQMYDQVKSGFPRDLAEASLLTRIAPLPLLGRLLQLPLKGKMATFAFSHLGKSAYRHCDFSGRRVANLFHMPRVPMPPGIGFFSNYYDKKLNLVIAYLEGLVDDQVVQQLDKGIRSRFGVLQPT